MTHLLRSISTLLIVFSFSACNMGSNQNENNTNQESKEKQASSEKAKEKTNRTSEQNQNTPYEGYQWASNDRFDFRIAIPKDWKVLKTSDNQDGFHIGADQEKVDIRCYGETLNAAIKSFDEEICQNSSTFSFIDDAEGKKCMADNEWYFFRKKNQEERVTFYIKAPKTWLDEHQDKLHKIARSLTFQNMTS